MVLEIFDDALLAVSMAFAAWLALLIDLRSIFLQRRLVKLFYIFKVKEAFSIGMSKRHFPNE